MGFNSGFKGLINSDLVSLLHTCVIEATDVTYCIS